MAIDIERGSGLHERTRRGRTGRARNVDRRVARAGSAREPECREIIGLSSDVEVSARRAAQDDRSGRYARRRYARRVCHACGAIGVGRDRDAACEVERRHEVVSGGAGIEIDDRIAVTVVDDVMVDAARGARETGRGRRGSCLDRDCLAIHLERIAVGEFARSLQRQRTGRAVDQRARADGGGRVVGQMGAGQDSLRTAQRGCRRRRRCAARSPRVEHVAVGGGTCVGRRAAQVGRRRARDRRGDVGFGRKADRGLERLVGDRLRRVDQLLQRCQAGVGRLQDLHAIADTIEQIPDVAGAIVERLRREKIGRIVERRVDALAGRQTALSGGEKIGSRLKR